VTYDKPSLAELERTARSAEHTGLNSVRYFQHPDEPQDVAWSPTVDGRDTCVPQSYADCYRSVDAAHIAAASPPVVLALVEIAKAAREVQLARQEYRTDQRVTCRLSEAHDALDKALAKVRP